MINKLKIYLKDIRRKFKKRSLGFRAGTIIGCCVLFILVGNAFVQWKVGGLFLNRTKKTISSLTGSFLQKAAKRKYKGDIIRKMILDPSRKYALSILYIDNKQIGRFKSNDDAIYDQEGDIPDGKVKFLNFTNNTYGIEYFRNKQRHGWYREYYSSGQMKREAKFVKGKKLLNKVYYIDGIMRKEEDLYDPLRFVTDSEVGSGKIYYRDGVLMYEWHLTNSSRGGYKKSYNTDGKLVEAKYYDANGDLVEIYEAE